MKKKLLLGCLAVLLSAAASFAQERPNRLVFHLKSGEVLAVPLAKADSVTFDRTSAAGDIRVDVTLVEKEGANIAFDVRRSPGCTHYAYVGICSKEQLAGMSDYDIVRLKEADAASGLTAERLELSDQSVLLNGCDCGIALIAYDELDTPCSVTRVEIPYRD